MRQGMQAFDRGLENFCMTPNRACPNKLTNYTDETRLEMIEAFFGSLLRSKPDRANKYKLKRIDVGGMPEAFLDFYEISCYMWDRTPSNLIQGIYLHGSYATKDYIDGWSGIDCFIVLEDEAL